MIFTNEFVLVLYLSFSSRYLVEEKLLQNLKNKAIWTLDMGNFKTYLNF